MAPRSRILLAVPPAEADRMERVLAGHEVARARDSAHARELLERVRFALVILGVHFDESQMFSLLADIRAHAKYRKVPILCLLGEHGPAMSDIAIEGLDHAVKAMTANGFLSLANYGDDEEGNARVRRIADYLVLIDGDLQYLTRAARRAPARSGQERRRGAQNH
jgi:PleD family two-component response regulator